MSGHSRLFVENPLWGGFNSLMLAGRHKKVGHVWGANDDQLNWWRWRELNPRPPDLHGPRLPV